MYKIKQLLVSSIFTIVMLTGCSSNKENVIHIASKPMSEQYVIVSMFKMLVEENTDLSVEVSEGIGGGTSNIQSAMESEEFDVYPEYTGTGWNEVLKEKGFYTEDLFNELQEKYQSMDMQWIGMIGFNNTFGIVVRKEIAEKYNLKTYSDLANIANQLTFGAEYDFFEREDGYEAFTKAYGLTFKDTMDLDIGLKYEAIEQDKIDVMNIFTTDGQLSNANVTVLEDDKNFYPSYTCGFVIRQEILKQNPELNKVFAKFENLISDHEMAEMNYQVESKKKDPEDVAEEFLKKKGLIK